jgi:hypothetical protein
MEPLVLELELLRRREVADTRRAWGVDYHAVRHRSRLVVSIKRLRDALGAELIATVDGGYALTAPTWLVLE